MKQQHLAFVLLFLTVLTFEDEEIMETHMRCGINEEKFDAIYEETNYSNADIPFTPFEIHYDYTQMAAEMKDPTIQSQVSNAYYAFIINILEESKKMLNQLLLVQRPSGKLKIPQCRTHALSSQVKNDGVNADIVIVPHFQTNFGPNTLASAGPCVIRSKPIAGIINISTKLTNFSKKNANEYYLAVLLHEITHILAFNSNLFKYFRDANNQPYSKTLIYKKINGIERKLLATPKVVAVARKHFNCPTLEGLELEDNGGSGTAGSHWEARVMMTDYMIGMTGDEMFISDISLALFEDSGWYKVNYYTGGLFKFGKNEGCKFLDTKCIVNKKSAFPKEFCDKTLEKKNLCLNGKTTKGVCYISTFSDLSPQYKYFDDMSGGHSLADYCPIVASFSDTTHMNAYHCKLGIAPATAYGEVYSDTSLCFISSLTLPNGIENNRAICYSYECNFKNNSTIVTVFDKEIKCPTNGGSVKSTHFKGTLECPVFADVCSSTVRCSGLADCIQKKSLLLDNPLIAFGSGFINSNNFITLAIFLLFL